MFSPGLAFLSIQSFVSACESSRYESTLIDMININDLPRKILQKIFVMAFESRVLFHLNHRHPTPSRYALRPSAVPGSKVCAYWKEIIRDTPRLYVMRLVLGIPDEESEYEGSSPLPLSVYQSWLENSNESMLDIHFSEFWSYRDSTEYFNETMEMILPHSHRWRVLNASRLSPQHTMLLLTHIVNGGNLDALRCIGLGRGTVSLDESLDYGLQVLCGRAHDFEQLLFKEVPSIWAKVPRYTHLRELEVDIAQFCHLSSWDNIFAMLGKAPLLTDLKLTISQPPESPQYSGRPSVGNIATGNWIRCPSLQRLELKMEFRCAVFFIDKVELVSLTNLHVISICITPYESEIQWPCFTHSLPSLEHFTCRHVDISDVMTFFTCFHCPSLQRLYIYPPIVSADNTVISLGQRGSSTTLVGWLNGSTSKLKTSFSEWSLKKSMHYAERDHPIIYSSQLPSLEYLHLDAVFPESTSKLLADIDMPNLKDLDVSSYHPLQCSTFDNALRNCTPMAPLFSLTNLKIDSLDQCCLLRLWTRDVKQWRHLHIRDKHGNSRIHWTKFCSHYQDILSEIQALTLRVRAYWLSVPEPFTHFSGLLSLTLEFDSTSDGLFQSLMAGRISKDKIPLPALKALYLKDCDLDSLQFLKQFIVLRKEAGKPLKMLSIFPFPGNQEDVRWLEMNVAQLDYEWSSGGGNQPWLSSTTLTQLDPVIS